MTGSLQEWEARLQEMQRYPTASGLAARFGPPSHKMTHGDLEIWHYPLGFDSGQLYSIHVAVSDGRLSQVYLYFEPAPANHPGSRPPWWKFWA